MKKIRVAMLATPWLPIPPEGYGGIENLLSALIPELIKLGVEVELFTTGDSTLPATKRHFLYPRQQNRNIHQPWYDSGPIIFAHILHALNIIRESGDFDVIHDHNNFFGPIALANTQDDLPPAIHTLHNPAFTANENTDTGIPDTMMMWRQLTAANKLRLVAISNALTKDAPPGIKHLYLPCVHNAIDVSQFPFVSDKKDYFITLARFHPEKGQHIAIQAAKELNVPLKMAGVVGDLKTYNKILTELANPLSRYRSLVDFRYFSDYIFPNLFEDSIEYIGVVSGQRKLDFIGHAKALLYPVQWEEPFGMAVIEALACGTPVIAMNRGAMPEIIRHGYNGFLANSFEEFRSYMKKIDEIQPANCRQSVEENFSANRMARQYLEHYKTVIGKAPLRAAGQ